MAWDLTALLNAADPASPLAERHLWLVRLLEWVRHDSGRGRGGDEATPVPVLRLRQFCQVLERHDEHRAAVQGVIAAFLREADAISLLADFGFAPRASFGSELMQRIRARVLPGTPETRNVAELFPLLFDGADAAWIARVDDALLVRLAQLWPSGHAPWRDSMLDAIMFLCSAVRAAGFSSALRLRMSAAALANMPFRQLAAVADRLRSALAAGDTSATQQEALYLRALLAECRGAADTVADHLEDYGVSLHLVFEVDQLRGRTYRIEQLLDCLLAESGPREVMRLLQVLTLTLQQRRSVRALLSEQSTQLSRQVAERSAETGEHYITRTRAQYRAMLRAAARGGAVLAGTTFGKFAVAALGLSAFWTGIWSGANYAASFVIVMLLHGTVATKQPAMTAPALALKLGAIRRDSADRETAAEAFVDEVTHLIRSQSAGIVGNLALCFPLVLAAQLLAQAVFGTPIVGKDEAEHVLQALTLLGPTALFAAFTGVLLFASSLIAGWVENWFVFNRLDSALRWNPRIVERLGAPRAQRWALWWRRHVSGVAANVSLGLMLGLVPVLLDFVGPPVEVRHVTLSTGQLGAALGALGTDALRLPAFWWCVAGIAVTGALNVGVSFALAFRVALRGGRVQRAERMLIHAALRQRLRQAPLSFLLPPASR
jgi:site-specific recombinase